MKRVKDCKDVFIMSSHEEWKLKTVKFVYYNLLVLLSTSVCCQNINKQNVNIADYSFLSRYHYTKSKNYLKRRYRIRHWIPMFIGTPCMIAYLMIWQRNKQVYSEGNREYMETDSKQSSLKSHHLRVTMYSPWTT